MTEAIIVIVVILALAIVAVLILAARKPDTFSILREIDIKAQPERIFPLIEDFRRWGGWSPWENRDPAMQRTFSGPPSGKGAVYAWQGNKNVGSGRMEIMEAALPNRIVIKLDFLAPFEAHNTAEFNMLPQGERTRVTWRMFGPSSFMMKVMHVFMNMDKMVG